MSTDFSKYQSIINKLRGEVNSSDFEAKFNQLTQKLSKKDKFLLKMEVKRLASPCTRLVDLRGLVNGECRLYEHEDRSHYLDDVAIKIFEENLAYYGGYTFGVYEAVMNTENNFRVIYQKEKNNIKPSEVVKKATVSTEKNQYPAKLISSSKYPDRCEERMNYAINLTLTINEQKIEAVSSDISTHGCKIRLTGQQPLHLDQVIQIRFTGLEQDFQFGKKHTFDYQICNLHSIDNVQFVGVRLMEQECDSFTKFLAGYIQGNKRRYKINLDNTIAALSARSFEHFALPKTNELVVFCQQNNSQLAPRYTLTCHNSNDIFHYWHDEVYQPTLRFLLNEERLQRLQKTSQNSLLVYCFIHKNNGKSYFYSADELQLKEDKESMAQFLGFAASKESFAIFSLSLHTVDESLAASSYILSGNTEKKDQHLMAPLSNEVNDVLASLPYFVTINKINEPAIVSDYQTLDCEVRDIAKLKQFGHRKSKQTQVVDQIEINYSNQRQEVRFIYNTAAQISTQGVSWTGETKDFSVSGVKIALDKPAVLTKGEIVYLSFPKLQKMTSKFELNKLPYEVVRTNLQKTVVSLRAYVEKHQHVGRSFFKFLIEKNQDKLDEDEYDIVLPGLAKALRNIYAHSFITPNLIIQTSGSRYKIDNFICSEEPHQLFAQMKALSERENHFNLYPLLHNAKILDGFESSLKKMQVDDAVLSDVLYISIKSTNDPVEARVTTKRESEFSASEMKKMFIKRALKVGDFYCVRLTLSRTKEPDMAYLAPELNYISTYAIHRAKQLEQEIWSVAGVIQVQDITSEALFRYKLL